ncbi:MAG: hypothetical protein LBR28_00225 [Bacteroidales bacterium]|jgi:hypothetical protein|nr:hypothetical protein [Bacteroidales bacterium]
MTYSKDWIFRKEDDFFHQAEVQVDYYDQQKEFLEIPSATVTNLKAEFQKYKSDYELYLASNKSATKPDTIKRNMHKEVVIGLLRDMYNLYVRLNPKVKNDDREANYFPVFDTKKTSLHPPLEPPVFEVKAMGHGLIELAFGYNMTDGGKLSHGLPKGADGVAIHYFIGDVEPTTADKMLSWGVDTRSPIKMIFGAENESKRVWIAMRYFNVKGEYSLWSDIKSLVIN